jgi:hypothetical protein
VTHFKNVIEALHVMEIIGFDRVKQRELTRLYLCKTTLIMWLDQEIKKACDEAERRELNVTKG